MLWTYTKLLFELVQFKMYGTIIINIYPYYVSVRIRIFSYPIYVCNIIHIVIHTININLIQNLVEISMYSYIISIRLICTVAHASGG